MNLKNTCGRTGAYILIDSLVQNGVEHIFGYPGGAILPIYDEIGRASCRERVSSPV